MSMQRDPFREWREQYARCCLNVDFEPMPGTTFHASVKPIFPELEIVGTGSTRVSFFATRICSEMATISFEYIVAQSQELNIAHRGREIRLSPGDATVKPIDFVTLRCEIDIQSNKPHDHGSG